MQKISEEIPHTITIKQSGDDSIYSIIFIHLILITPLSLLGIQIHEDFIIATSPFGITIEIFILAIFVAMLGLAILGRTKIIQFHYEEASNQIILKEYRTFLKVKHKIFHGSTIDRFDVYLHNIPAGRSINLWQVKTLSLKLIDQDPVFLYHEKHSFYPYQLNLIKNVEEIARKLNGSLLESAGLETMRLKYPFIPKEHPIEEQVREKNTRDGMIVIFCFMTMSLVLISYFLYLVIRSP